MYFMPFFGIMLSGSVFPQKFGRCGLYIHGYSVILSSVLSTSDVLQNCTHAASIQHTAYAKLPVGWVYSVSSLRALSSLVAFMMYSCNCLFLWTVCISSQYTCHVTYKLLSYNL